MGAPGPVRAQPGTKEAEQCRMGATPRLSGSTGDQGLWPNVSAQGHQLAGLLGQVPPLARKDGSP